MRVVEVVTGGFVATVVALLGLALGVVPAGATYHAPPAGKDPAKETVLIGVQTVAAGTADEMSIKFEIEPAKGMLMPKGGHGGMAMEMTPGPQDKYHFEVKPEDPKSKTRISYTTVKFLLKNEVNGKTVEAELHPMWGGSGLHYAANGPLPGDGPYAATVTVEPPTFSRDAAKDRDRWMRPVTATFRFRVVSGLVVSE